LHISPKDLGEEAIPDAREPDRFRMSPEFGSAVEASLVRTIRTDRGLERIRA